MDTTDRIALMVVFSMGSYLTVIPFLDWQHKNTVTAILGGLMVFFCLWAVISEVTKRYKIVEVK